MNYQWHYDQLMITRKSRITENGVYYETHHIIPKSMGGDNSSENLVILTAREHFLAHWLLWRIHRNKEMAFAFFAMCSWIKKGRRKTSSKIYSEAREALCLTIGKRSTETKQKCSDSRIAHEVRWSNELTVEEAQIRINNYHKSLSIGVKKYHDNRDKTVSRYSDEGRKNLNSSRKGSTISEEHKEKIRIKSQQKGRKLIVVECPHCKKTGKGGNMTRYHFNNCKLINNDNTIS